MDELGSAPRIHFGDKEQYNQDADQNGSWFGLAISGLKFLINNQNNHNVNHNLNPQSNNSLSSSGPNSNGNNNNNNSSSNISSAKSNHNPTNKSVPVQQKKQKLHILGPSVFKKQLYDIPEYQSTADNNKKRKNSKQFKTNSRLTKQALQQFNGNFSNYWNQRSSLHSHYGSSNGEHGDDETEGSNAGSIHTSQSHGNITNNTKTDGAPSTIHQNTDEHNPSMTSSQIIHPTQDKQVTKLSHSRSFPLLHSAEYIQNFQQFTFIDDAVNNFDEEGSQCNYIPSPPPISSTPDINQSILLPKVKNVTAIKSWESVNSSNIGSVRSFGDDGNSDIGTDGIVLTQGQGQQDGSLVQLLSDNHFIREKKKSSIKQKQWLRESVSKMRHSKQRQSTPNTGGSITSKGSSFDDTMSCSTATTGLVHVHHGSKIQTELDWTECNETVIGQVLDMKIPKSIKKNKNKKKKKKYKDNVNGNDSDWSQVSSNLGVVTTPTTQQ